jgi:hypothetical protein
LVEFTEHIDELLVDALVDARMLGHRQLAQLAEPAKGSIDSWLSGRLPCLS